jgi:hypothetical protein
VRFTPFRETFLCHFIYYYPRSCLIRTSSELLVLAVVNATKIFKLILRVEVSGMPKMNILMPRHEAVRTKISLQFTFAVSLSTIIV